jgi:hypothetical protein
MESMEPKDIDWSRVVSRYVRDETYEGIQAPRWVDLDDPDAVAVDDHAWFCRPGTYTPSLHSTAFPLPLPRARAREPIDRASARGIVVPICRWISTAVPEERDSAVRDAFLLIWGWISLLSSPDFVSVLAKFRLCF